MLQIKDSTVTPNVQLFFKKKKKQVTWLHFTILLAQLKDYLNIMLIGMLNFWIVAPTPNANYEITLAYVKQPDTITSGTPSTAGTYNFK